MRVDHGQPAFRLLARADVAVDPAPPLAAVERADVVVSIAVPPSPPADVVERMHAAAAIAERLAADNRELHFRKDPASNRIVVEVRDLRGTVIRTIPPSAALETLAPGAWR